ncbi:conjugal transfer nickase/helicase domain-containing protein [Cedecea sp. NFIX57]|uniref:conjugal transfer nickase/helicase domain-containing protein n=1 Tax=Cedecea sp. NFIX57 TaxID=1566286 RepID=UPI000A0B6D44|nr:TraI domain-containing protein [Cedecea sp. NFIX57]SMG55541.1 integrating conjugative element relaxase, PFL_4751 family [Cedecea sp. NFIX57]
MKLSWLKSLSGRGRPQAGPPVSIGPAQQVVPGYHIPQTVAVLTATPARQPYLQQLWDNSALPAEQYQRLYFSPLAQLLVRVQNVPAARSGPWSESGGYGDMVMKFVSCAVRLAKTHLLPPGVAPEEQAAQGPLWNAVVFWAALFYHLPLLSQLEGELRGGQPWLPGMSVPDGPYRFRFCSSPLSAGQNPGITALMAGQLLPGYAPAWLSTCPATLQCLGQQLCRLPFTLPVIDELLLIAVEKSGAALSLPASPAPASTTLSAAPVNPAYIPPVSGETAPVAPVEQPVKLPPALETAFSAIPAGGTESIAPAVSDGLVPDEDTLALLTLLAAVEPAATDSVIVPGVSLIAETGGSPGTDIDGAGQALSVSPDIDTSLPEQRTDIQTGTWRQHAASGVSGLSENKGGLEEGEAFWGWLHEGLRQGKMSINCPDDKLHLVAGFLFLPVPGIFFQYLKENARPTEDRERVQESFELLSRHKRRDNRRFFFARIYTSGEGNGPFKRAKGYLIRGNLLFSQVPRTAAT